VQTTRAVTINAAPQQVWPWLVQTGQGRSGFYSDSRFWDRSVDSEPGKTRLIRRMRLRCGPRPFRAYVVPIVMIWGEAITARNLLRGVKRRAETTRQPD
jgi:hypothetical protein